MLRILSFSSNFTSFRCNSSKKMEMNLKISLQMMKKEMTTVKELTSLSIMEEMLSNPLKISEMRKSTKKRRMISSK